MNDSTSLETSIPLSILDLAIIKEGQTAADTYRHSVELAQKAEQWGYQRFWLAEHHNMASIASSATAVLIGHIAGHTHTIRVGSGGIMLPNHAPLVIAEQFGTLEYLYPGRIDLGIGRAPGTDATTARALRRSITESPNDFPESVLELQNYFSPHNVTSKVRAIPGEGLSIPIWLLGSSTYSAQLSAYLGLPFAFASHFAPTYLMEALHLYRQHFTASDRLQQPYAMACVNIIVAGTDAEAQYLATSLYQMAMTIIHGKPQPLKPPVQDMDTIWSDYEKVAIQQMLTYSFIGSAATVKKELQQFVATTGVQEIMVTAHIYDHQARLNSYDQLSKLWNEVSAVKQYV